MWIWVDLIVEEVVAVCVVDLLVARNVELPQSSDECFRTVDEVLINS